MDYWKFHTNIQVSVFFGIQISCKWIEAGRKKLPTLEYKGIDFPEFDNFYKTVN